MAITRIEDIDKLLENAALSDIMMSMMADRSAFIGTGAAIVSPFLRSALDKGSYATTRFINEDHDEPNISGDDPAIIAASNKITDGAQDVHPSHLNIIKGYAAIAQNALKVGIERAVLEIFSAYWQREHDNHCLSALLGAAGTGTGLSLTQDSGTEVFTTDLHYDALQKLGDQSDKVALMVCNSAMATAIRKLNVKSNTAKYMSEAKDIEYFGDLRMIVTDKITSTAGVSKIYYLAPGALNIAGVVPPNGFAYQKDEKAANGGGVIDIISRYSMMTGIAGFSFSNKAALVNQSVSKAALATPDNYTYVYDSAKKATFCALRCRYVEA